MIHRNLVLSALLAFAAIIGGCGASSSSSSMTPSAHSGSKTVASAAQTQLIPAARPRPGAIPALAGGLKSLVPVPRPSTPAVGLTPAIVGAHNIPLRAAIEKLAADVNQFWSAEFGRSNVQWPAMQEAFVSSSPVGTRCAGKPAIAPSDAWYLCDARSGGTFYWTLPWIQQNIDIDPGRVNLALGIAELWSLHVQDLLGYTAQLQQGAMTKGAWAQQTACLTGIYVRSADDRKLLEQADIQSIRAFLAALGNVNGITAPDVTQKQLQQALIDGYNSGKPAFCLPAGGSGTSTSTTTTP